MTNDKIAEIRARHQRIETTDDAILVNLEFSWANDDRGWLLAEVERLREALRWYADRRNHLPVLHHRMAGDPDPVAVFVEEPPIMDDCGRRAREALEVKP